MIRNVLSKDAKDIAAVYNYYVDHTIVTFDEIHLSSDFFLEKISSVTNNGYPWLVYEKNGKVEGYAYASIWKDRTGYRETAEISIYLSENISEKGIGTKMYSKIIEHLKNMGVHTVIGGIALPNERSVALHKKFGFEQVALYKEIGYKFNKRIDVSYWQLFINKKQKK